MQSIQTVVEDDIMWAGRPKCSVNYVYLL